MNIDREHLDAETVAAWIDGGLDARSLAAAEAHASNCERCQALLATVARTLPAESAAAATHQARSTLAFWKWLTPLAAAAAAVTIWMVVPQDPMQPEQKAAPQSDVSGEVAAGRDSGTAAPSPVVPIAPPVIPERAARSAAPRENSDRFSEARQAAPKERAANQAFEDRELKREDARAEAAMPAPAAAPPPSAPAARAAEAPAAPARDTAGTGAALGAVAQSQLRKQSAPIEIVSPAPQRRWRVLPAAIEYSPDGGRTWIPVRINSGDAITAGTSPAAQVCWIVGQQGLVLLATDGTNFTRLPFPERVDLVAVTATDARRATVTTADGRTFQTIDNGRNWRNP